MSELRVNDITNLGGTIPDGVGRIVQVVRATDSTLRSTTSNSFVDANISVSITPESASSNLIVIWSALTLAVGSPNSILEGFLQISDSSDVALSGAEDARSFVDTSSAILDFHTDNLLLVGYVSAGSTSARTYKGRFRFANGLNFQLLNSTKTGQMFVIEVAA